jgi:hypothetical protein
MQKHRCISFLKYLNSCSVIVMLFLGNWVVLQR